LFHCTVTTRAVAFTRSQYPQFSCTTTGSSLNHLWRELKRLDMGEEFEWSVIDRWPTHDGFLSALTDRVQKRHQTDAEGETKGETKESRVLDASEKKTRKMIKYIIIIKIQPPETISSILFF
jgi:protoheme ferro-lyase